MFFATASERLIPASEKQEMPACLPLVSFLGDERATMQYETSTGITVKCRHEDRDEMPYLMVHNVPGIPGIHLYRATSFLITSAENRAFTIGPAWNDQEPFVISIEDVQAVAAMVRSASDRKRGYFETMWVALGPADPF